MLQQLQLTNFKSFAGEAAPIPFAPVTILVGANASGKSNVFDAIRFLQGIGMGFSIAEILTGKWEGGREIYPPLRGGAEEACWGSEESFCIQSSLDLVAGSGQTWKDGVAGNWRAQRRSFAHAITCRSKPDPSVESETLRIGGQGQVTISPHSLSREFTRRRSCLFEAANQAEIDAYERFLCTVLLGNYSRSRFLDVRPSEMKGYVPRAAPELGAHGENLSAVLCRILQDRETKEQYLDWLSAFCAPPVKDIEFDETKSKDVLVQLVEGDGEQKSLSARSVSDGTLRFMGLLAALFSAPTDSLFLLEEIENGLHPTRVHLLVELLEQFAASRRLQIIATTHSSQVLLSLSEQALRDVVLFARTPECPGTITRRLGDLPHFDEVAQKTKIDRLFTTGWLERAL